MDFGVNSDAQALLTCQAPTKVQIGEQLTRGLGSGGDPEIGKKAAEESLENCKLLCLKLTWSLSLVVWVGNWNGACPIIADIARKSGALTVAVVTKPFAFEGAHRRVVGEEGLKTLKIKSIQ